MSLVNASILTGTTVSAAGGTAVNYTPDGVTIPNGMHLIDAAVADYRVRPQLTVKTKFPTVDSLGVYSKDKKSCILVEPYILASGKTVFNLIRIEREVHPEFPAANALDLNKKGAQMLTDSDFTSFWATGSTA